MKLNLRAVLNNLLVIIARNPVEIIISIAFFTLSSLTWEDVMSQKEYGENLFLAPLLFSFSYVLNRIFDKGPGRAIYFLSALTAAIPFLVISTHWVFSGAYISSLAIALVVVAVYTNIKDNLHIVKNILAYARELLFTMIIVTAIYVVLLATIFSFIYLFDLFRNSSESIGYYITTVCYIIFAPLAFLYFNADPDNKRAEFRITRIFDVVISYILAPALIIYTTILYLYITKIVITWSLPKGNLAYMVFAFIISALIIKACMPLVTKPIFTRFFRSFSIIAIAPLSLFWIGALHRVAEYGFTEERVYLLVCGAILSLTVLLFISRKHDKYIYVGYITIVLLSLFSYIPQISAKDIGIKSQQNQLQIVAKELNILGEAGKLTPPAQPFTDSVSRDRFERLADIYTYLGRQMDKNRLQELYGYSGVSDFRTDFGLLFTFKTRNNYFIERKGGQIPTTGYGWVEMDITTQIAKDTMKIKDSQGKELFGVPMSLLNSKFKIPQVGDSTLQNQPADSLLQLEIENYRVLFSRISFGKDGNISKATIKALLVKSSPPQ